MCNNHDSVLLNLGKPSHMKEDYGNFQQTQQFYALPGRMQEMYLERELQECRMFMTRQQCINMLEDYKVRRLQQFLSVRVQLSYNKALAYTAPSELSRGKSCLGLLAEIKVFGALPAHLTLVLDAGTALVSIPPLKCAGFVNCHCTGRWVVLDNTHGKDSGVFC